MFKRDMSQNEWCIFLPVLQIVCQCIIQGWPSVTFKRSKDTHLHVVIFLRIFRVMWTNN